VEPRKAIRAFGKGNSSTKVGRTSIWSCKSVEHSNFRGFSSKREGRQPGAKTVSDMTAAQGPTLFLDQGPLDDFHAAKVLWTS